MQKRELQVIKHDSCGGVVELVEEEQYALCITCGAKIPFEETKKWCTLHRIKLLGDAK